jgi:uncharacterized protein (TIGR03083 family)
MTSSLVADSYGLADALDAWEGSLHAVSELAKRLNADGWAAPTECPGWSAGDIVRHLSWIEARLAGRTDPEIEIDWATLPHATSDFARLTEAGVQVRRGQSQAEACAELDGLIDVRLAQILALEPLTLDTEVMGVFGRPTPLRRLLRVRTFDTWTHEQDVRRAVGLPGNLTSPGAQQSAAQIASALPFVLSAVEGATPGDTLRICVTGPVEFVRYAVKVDDSTSAAAEGVDDATFGLTTDWETFGRLAAGRLDLASDDVLARIALTGDPALAAQLPEALAITP